MSLARFIRNALSSGKRFPRNFYFLNDSKPGGRLVGTDEFGNRYYEETDTEIWVRQRWVESPSNDFDPSTIPAKWHYWIHRIGDEAAVNESAMANKWLAKHTPNYTGTPGAYRSFNTTAPKIQTWEPMATPRE
ncbi:NADH ubiquinone oxidoreductase subunit NDUFA12-domain-containing protein [Thamnocephalis sphaerospora]|uniref:NADH dehydrogenase [ubiquinone] 1 alpha subcomplex subunit n=1 Tax=Thamnocephalis sphaerospora TaxID=78915 RepID=A0A4P9XP57_9FUNG|nr:NADH ubiquinone oxidoreductase subunit NDUFA12-domain-containing protein [Thamnocephalis sphaerospora]|eukprot:RKP07777.1 NADH ubiquinone oxidoreductase subunit NDUFA12-domain-containing protein [Thamnocephalis sphaerospora]